MISLKWLSLLIMCIQNAATPLVFRLATTGAAASERYSTGVAVCTFELIKLAASLILIGVEEGSAFKIAGVVRREIIQKPADTLKLGIPALLYFIQNYCLQLASANLPAALFQVTYQGKTLVVAFCSVVLLQKRLKRSMWLAIALMGSGIAVVQMTSAKENKQGAMANAAEQNVMMGMVFVLIGCFCSGFAGVYFEKMMKGGKKVSMWVKNAQLASFSVLIGVLTVMAKGLDKDPSTGLSRPIYYGFTTPVWIMVFNNALGGLCVAFVIKHADNILKGFACALATILATLVSVPLFGFELKPTFFVGMIVVLGSTFLYGGTIKISKQAGDYWDSEPSLCAGVRERNGDDDTVLPTQQRCANAHTHIFVCPRYVRDKAVALVGLVERSRRAGKESVLGPKY